MPSETVMIALQVLALLFAVSFHESAHGLVALGCGDPTARDLGRISLNPLKHLDPFGSVVVPALLAFSGAPVFGWAKPVPVDLSRTREPRKANLLVSAAGPLSNVVLASPVRRRGVHAARPRERAARRQPGRAWSSCWRCTRCW